MTLLSRIKDSGWSCRLLLLLVVCWFAAWPAPAAARRPAAVTASTNSACVVSDWGPWTPCTRTGLHHWEHSHSRAVQKPAADCPPLTETAVCEANRAPRPSDAATAAQQAVSGLLINLPLAVAVGLRRPTASSDDRVTGMTVTPELASSMAAGRQLWQQQASRNDRLQCSPFNGPVELLRAAATLQPSAQQPLPADSAQLDAARSAFAAATKAVAMQGAANARSRAQPGSGASSGSTSNSLDVFRRAIVMPWGQAGSDDKSGGVLPPPAADAAADVVWDGSDRMTATVQAGPSMTAAAARTATEALHDGAVNMVPWLTVQDTAQQQSLAAAGFGLNMTYQHSQQAATFNSVDKPAAGGAPSTSGVLLLSIQDHLTGVYGLQLSSRAAREGLMGLPTGDAVLRTNAGGGVDQLGVALSGPWTQANLTAALGLHQGQGGRAGQQDAAAFTFTDPMLLFSAAPAALYVAVQGNVPALGVQDAPATINLRPGGAAALELFEPCEPVPGLQLSDVQLHLQPEGGLAGVASGKLASTAVSALATVSPSAPAGTTAGAGQAMQDAGQQQDLALVMTAETVGAGKLADVITIITRKDPPVKLLQSLLQQQQQQDQQQQQQRMQFSSVTLTYQSPKAARRRDGSPGPSEGSDGSESGGFNMVAVPDIKSAPALKQMLDAIGLEQESLTLRTSSIGSVGSAFGLAAERPYTLQLPAPFTASGPTLLTLQYGQQSTGSSVSPADTLLTTSLVGTSTAGLQLPGTSSPVAVDLSTVSVTTPTAIVGASSHSTGAAAAPRRSAPVNGKLGGNTAGAVGMQGLPFLQFGTLIVSADVEFSPLSLQDLKLTGPLSAFGVSGTAEFSASSSPVVQQDSTAGVGLMAFLPSVDVPLMARSLGANVTLGVLSADLRSVRAQIDPSSSTVQKKQAAARGPEPSRQQEPGTATNLAVAAELRMLGMSSYVNFDMSAQQAASVAATFVEGQINRVLMPSLLSAVSAALQATSSSVTAAAAAAASGNRVSLAGLIEDAQEAVRLARQQLDAATATFGTANQKAVRQLQQASVTAEAAAATYHAARIQGGAALLAARNELNTADAAFNQAKSQAYKDLNVAQQAYKDALKGHDAVIKTAHDRVDLLVSQTLQLRAEYNAANMLCNPSPQGLEDCRAAAAAWVQYHTASVALDVAQTALQEEATMGASAQALRAAKARFATQQAVANEVVIGKEWAAHTAATAKLQAAKAALDEAEQGRVAARMRAANAEFVRAQDTARQLLSTAAPEYTAVRDAKHALKAARAGLKAATAVGRLSPEELAVASQDLASLVAQLQAQAAALARSDGAQQAADALVRFESINVGMNLAPAAQPGEPVLLAVSYSGAVGAGDQQKPLMGRFQLDVADSSSEELGLILAEVLRDDALSAIRATHRSLASLL